MPLQASIRSGNDRPNAAGNNAQKVRTGHESISLRRRERVSSYVMSCEQDCQFPMNRATRGFEKLKTTPREPHESSSAKLCVENPTEQRLEIGWTPRSAAVDLNVSDPRP